MREKNKLRIALCIFAYNRAVSIKRLFVCLEKLSNSGNYRHDLDVFIFYDGPKNRATEDVAETRAVEVPEFLNAEVVMRSENLGLASSVRKGVSAALERNDAVIVLEDDLIVGPKFFDYMVDSLEHYRESEVVASVSGFCYDISAVPSTRELSTRNYFSHRCMSWGWATWKSEWNAVDWDLQNVLKGLQCQGMQKKAGEDLKKLFELQSRNVIDSWAIYFCAYHLLSQKYCSFPSRNHVVNCGFDNRGTHTRIRPTWVPKMYFEGDDSGPFASSFNDVVWQEQLKIYESMPNWKRGLIWAWKIIRQ